jgi:hypothetical protein
MSALDQSDILFGVFTQLSSFDRLKVIPVCRGWYECNLQCISLIEKAPSLGDHFRLEHYQTIIRSEELQLEAMSLRFDYWSSDAVHMAQLYVRRHHRQIPNISKHRVMCDVMTSASQMGHIKTINWVFDMYGNNSAAQRDLQMCAFRGACQGQQIDMIKNYKQCTGIDVYVIYEAIINSGNNLGVIKEILDHYTVNQGELLDMAQRYGNDILVDWLIYGAPNSMLEL